MSPYLGTIAGYPIPTFALVLDVAVIAGVALAARLASHRGLSPTRFLDAALVVLLAALAGSRLWYAVAHAGEFLQSPLAIFAVWEGGLALPGAVTAGALAIVPAARLVRVPAETLAGAGVAGLALAQALGRLGCVPAGCAFGLPAALLPLPAPCLPLPDAAGVPVDRFPSQLVEATGELLLCLGLWRAWRVGLPSAAVAGLYLAGYGALRLALEPFRGDSTYVGSVALASLWAVLAMVSGAVLVFRSWARREQAATSEEPGA